MNLDLNTNINMYFYRCQNQSKTIIPYSYQFPTFLRINILVQNSYRCPNWSIDIHSKGNTLQREPKLVGEVYARQSQIHKTEVCYSSSFTVYFHFSIYKQGFYHILYFSPFPSRLGRTLRCRLPACSDFILPRKLSKLLDLSEMKINPNSIIDVCASFRHLCWYCICISTKVRQPGSELLGVPATRLGGGGGGWPDG